MALLYDAATGERVGWREVLDSYLSTCAASTARKWRVTIEQWTTFLDGKDLLEASTLDAERYKAEQAQRDGYADPMTGAPCKLSMGALASKISVLHSFYDRLRGHGFISHNPFYSILRDLNYHPGSKNGAREIPLEIVRKRLNWPYPPTKVGIRDKATEAILFGAGLRASGLLGLRVADVVREEGAVYLRVVCNKGKAEHIQALPQWAEQRVYELYLQRIREGAKPGEPLLVNYWASGEVDTEPIGYNTMRKRFERWMKDAGAIEHYTLHDCRATAASRLLALGCSEREVQDAFGWASARMVGVYDKRRFQGKSSVARKVGY